MYRMSTVVKILSAAPWLTNPTPKLVDQLLLNGRPCKITFPLPLKNKKRIIRATPEQGHSQEKDNQIIVWHSVQCTPTTSAVLISIQCIDIGK